MGVRAELKDGLMIGDWGGLVREALDGSTASGRAAVGRSCEIAISSVEHPNWVEFECFLSVF